MGEQEAVGRDAERGVMMEAAPFVVSEPHLLLECLVVALDPPAHPGHADEGGPPGVRRQCREPVLGRLVLTRRPFDEQPFARARPGERVVAMGRAHASRSKAPA